MATRCAGLRKSSSFPPVCGPCVQPWRRRAARRVALLGDGRPLSPHCLRPRLGLCQAVLWFLCSRYFNDAF